MTRAAVLAPGYGGTAAQPILRALARRLRDFDIASHAITFRTRGKRPSREYASELEATIAHQDRRLALIRKSPLVPLYRRAKRLGGRGGSSD